MTFKWKDYRAAKTNGHRNPWTTMTLTSSEFIRRFLIHVPPRGFHRIRHYGLFANGSRAEDLAQARQLLEVPAPPDQPDCKNDDPQETPSQPCPSCGGTMIIIETFGPGQTPSRAAWRYPARAPPESRVGRP